MTKRTFLSILVGFASLSVPNKLFAQDSDKVVILSPRVGSVIDAAERQRYELFPEVRGFDRGVFLQTPKKTYYAKVMFVGSDGERRDTTVQYSVDTLLVLAEEIEHFEDLKEKRYHMGDQPGKIELAESIRIFPNDLREQNRLQQLAERAGEAKEKVVILSPRVGSVIDATERQQYELFPEVRDFDRAVFLQTPKKTYYAKIMFVGPDGARTDTTVQYSEDTLSVLAERIEHFEELKQKTYQVGERPAKIRVAESELKSEGGVARRTQGTDVAVLLTSGQEIEGELVSVRDSSVLIATRTGDIVPIRDTVVSHVIVKGSSHVARGLAFGFVEGTFGGMIVGAAIGDATARNDPAEAFRAVVGGAMLGAVLGAVVGTVSGGLKGEAESNREIRVDLSMPAERSALKKLARYPDKEPEFLQVIK
ncbi:MAG: hypothetical protein WBW16_02760 [Bacteroidota bacterium]